jgi:uncharacterized protein
MEGFFMAKDYRYDEKTGSYVPIDEGHQGITGDDDKLIGILLWAMLFLELTFVPLVLSIVAYSYYKDKSPYLFSVAKETLNFQISLWIYGVVGIILSILTFGVGAFIVIPLIAIYHIAIPIVGILKALDKKVYIPHFTIRFIK